MCVFVHAPGQKTKIVYDNHVSPIFIRCAHLHLILSSKMEWEKKKQKPIIVFCTVDPIWYDVQSLSIVRFHFYNSRLLGNLTIHLKTFWYYRIRYRYVNCYRDKLRMVCRIKPPCHLRHTKYRVINQCRNFSFLRCVYIILCSYVVNDESHQIWNYFWTS